MTIQQHNHSFAGSYVLGVIACASFALCALPGQAQSANTPVMPGTTTMARLSLPDAPQPQQPQEESKPGTPSSSSSSAPSMNDLGISATQVHGDDRTQALLDKRTRMLKVHTRLGLITAVPILAACISGAGATPDRGTYGSTTSRDVHVGIAGLAVGMYGLTAYYAAAAPRIGHEPARGGIKVHKYLVYVHAPGMILTPILGAMAFNQINSGQQVHGIASAHQAVAVTTALAYGASILAVSYPIHFHRNRTQLAISSTPMASNEAPSLTRREAK